MNVQSKPLEELTQDALRILGRELGVVDTVRFLNQFTTGFGDYTEERKHLFKGLTIEDVLSDIQRLREDDPT